MIPVAMMIHAQSLLTVGTVGLRNTQPLDTISTAGRSREFRFIVEVHATAQHEMTFLL